MRKILILAMIVGLCFSASMRSLVIVPSVRAASENLLVNGGFETGNFDGWKVNGVCSISNTKVHSGTCAAYISDAELNNSIIQEFLPQALPIDNGLTIDAWIYPNSVGGLDGVYPMSSVSFAFLNSMTGQVAFWLFYSWSWSIYKVNTTGYTLFTLPDWSTGQWNELHRNVTADMRSYYGQKDFTGIYLGWITIWYHYSNGDPGAFYADDLELLEASTFHLALTPQTGFASTTAVGSGFTNNSAITITWDGTTIPTIPNTVTTDATGSFTALISVLTQTAPGTHIVNATDDSGNWRTATFTVVDMTGPQGLQGSTGLQGQQGLKGDTGPQGSTGLQGPKGERGDTGPQGPAGTLGETQLVLIAFPTAASIFALCIAVVALLRRKT